MLGTNFAGWDQDEGVIERVRAIGLDTTREDSVIGRTAIRYFRLDIKE
jgi:hypothetical protein